MFFIVIHTVIATGARVAGIIQLAHLLHGQERELFGDQAYWKEADRQVFTAQGVHYPINGAPVKGCRSITKPSPASCTTMVSRCDL